MTENFLERYAELVVGVGVNVQPGQDVYVRAEVEHAPVVRRVAEHAYRARARRVFVEYADGQVRRSALDHAPLEGLTTAPGWAMQKVREWAAEGAAVISLTGNPDPHRFDGVDAERLAAQPLDLAREQRQVLLSGSVTWCVVAAPNPGWAQQIFGEPDEERLWQAVATAMRLDAPDVVAAWQEHVARLEARARALDSLGLDAVRYHGEGTDLTVGLIPGCRWTGGGLTTSSGVRYLPNLPTEEVFTTPDRRRADGVIRLTRPLVLPRAGVLVEGLVARFEAGRIVAVEADSGADAVRAELDTDDGARSLGEVSVVDGSSRIRQAGVVFHDTLYDENAGCHVAWGQGFPFSVPDGAALDADQLGALGVNQSAVHTDVVVGGPGVHVDGILPDGRVAPLIRDDVWVLPSGEHS